MTRLAQPLQHMDIAGVFPSLLCDGALHRNEVCEMSQAIQGRFTDPDVEQIDDWRRGQRSIPSRADALRTLVKRGLEREKRAAKRDPNKPDTAAAE